MRGLSVTMQDLFRLSDWAWVILGGLVFPVMWYFFITRLTPLGAREWSVMASDFIQPLGQFGSMVFGMIILPVLIANWRLAKRGAVFGLASGNQRLGWLAAAAAISGVPVYGATISYGRVHGMFWYASLGLSGVAALWILTGMGLSLFGRQSQALRRAILTRILPPVWVFGMLLFVALTPYFYSQEKRWIQQDRLFSSSPEFPAPMRYEYEVAQILRGELKETLDSMDEKSLNPGP